MPRIFDAAAVSADRIAGDPFGVGSPSVRSRTTTRTPSAPSAAMVPPIAISAFTGEALDYRGVAKIDSLAKFSPGLVIQNNPGDGGSSASAASLPGAAWQRAWRSLRTSSAT